MPRLYGKLGASNRAQALMTAVQHGLIGHGPDEAGIVPLIAAQWPGPGVPAALAS